MCLHYKLLNITFLFIELPYKSNMFWIAWLWLLDFFQKCNWLDINFFVHSITLFLAVQGEIPSQHVLGNMVNYYSCTSQKITLILIALLVFLNTKLIWGLYRVDCCWCLCTVQMGWASFTSIKRASASRGHLLTLQSERNER